MYSTALSKIERGTEQDFADVLALLAARRIDWERLASRFREILPQFGARSLKQDPEEFQRKFNALSQMRPGGN